MGAGIERSGPLGVMPEQQERLVEWVKKVAHNQAGVMMTAMSWLSVKGDSPGEDLTYTYDALNRLMSAVTTGL